MGAALLEGRQIAARMLAETRERGRAIRERTGVTPTLATVIVGDDPASRAYVRAKRARCEQAGIASVLVELPADSTTEEVVHHVRTLAHDEGVHAVLVQHPVPGGVDRRAVFESIPVEKDVDGVSSATLGRILLGLPAFAPCTPRGILRLLDEHAYDAGSAHAIVIGRSPILGRPMASMLINRHATVTLCHSRTRDLSALVSGADLVIAAVGKPRFVLGAWIKRGAVVVDAGYSPGANGPIGDVEFDAACERAGMITPVPGGVGPMTIAVLLEQTVDAAARQLGAGSD